MLVSEHRKQILWAGVGLIVLGLVIWTLIVGDDKRLPESAAPGPETLNQETPPPSDGQPSSTTPTEEQPAPPPSESPSETPTPEATTGETPETSPSIEENKQE